MSVFFAGSLRGGGWLVLFSSPFAAVKGRRGPIRKCIAALPPTPLPFLTIAREINSELPPLPSRILFFSLPPQIR